MKASQCAFVQYTQRSAAEAAAEKTFNKLIINGKRWNIKWGKSQAQMGMGGKDGTKLEGEEGHTNPVPGLPGGTHLLHDFFIHVHCNQYFTFTANDISKVCIVII